MSKAKSIYKANKETTLRNYEKGLNQYYSQKYQNTVDKNLRDEQAKDTFRLNMQIRNQREDAKLEAFEKSEGSFLDQLIFNQKAEKEALEGEEKVFNERILANAFETDETNLAYKKQIIDSRYEYNSSERALSDAANTFTTTQALLQLSSEKQTTQAEGERDTLLIRKQEARANSNTEQYKNKLQALQEEGTARAKGRAGRSAERSLQSIQALSGVNSALIADRLSMSERSIQIEQDIVNKQLGPNGYISREKTIRTTQAQNQKTSTTKNLQAQQKQIAKSLGITTEQFNMTREQLGRSLLSAADSYEKRVSNIKQQKFAADMNAYAQRQLSPRVQPPIPAPFETKLPILIKPPKPVKPVKTKTGGQMGQDSNPVLQGISGVAGAVATAAAVIPGGQVVAGVAGAVSFGASLIDRIF